MTGRDRRGRPVRPGDQRPLDYGLRADDGSGGRRPDGPIRIVGRRRPGIQNHHDYWIDRDDRYDRVVVPGDGTAIWPRVYVVDLARAIRRLVETGTPGEAYNGANGHVYTMDDVIQLIAERLDTSVEIVHASRCDLECVGLDPDEFVLYHHLGSEYPHVLSNCRLLALG